MIVSFNFQIHAKADNEILVTEEYEQNFSLNFSKVEKTGIIQSFAVADDGRIATFINNQGINIYDEYGFYDFTIYKELYKINVTLQWDNDILLIYLSSSWDGNDYKIIKVNGYEDYEIFSCPDNGETRTFWNTLDNHDYELITDKGRYYVKYGNLRYTDKESGADHAVTENTSFKPWWLLSIPALTAIIWFGFLRKRVKTWEAWGGFAMNRKIFDILSENGWTTDRKTDITDILEWYHRNHYSVNPEQIRLLENLANLDILLECEEFLDGEKKRHYTYKIQFFPIEYSLPDEFMESYEKYVNTKLIPIGGIHFTNVSLLMDSQLKIYGVADSDIALLGNRIFEAIENLYENKEIVWKEIDNFYS